MSAELKLVRTLTTSYPRYSGDEAGVFIARLVQAISHEAQAIDVVAPWDYKEPQVDIQDNILVSRVPYGFFSRGRLAYGAGMLPNVKARPWLIFQAPGMIARFTLHLLRAEPRHQLVHAHWAFSALAAWLARLVSRTPYVVTLRGEDMKLLTSPYTRWIFQRAIQSAAAVITVSQEFADFCKNALSIPANQLFWIPNGVDVPERSVEEVQGTYQKYRLSLQAPSLIFVGRVIPLKRCELALQLLSALPEYQLILCGRPLSDSYLNSLKTIAQDLRILDRCHFLGAVSPEDIPALLRGARYFFTASESEGRPNSLMEGMVAGAVALASNISAHRELIRDGENGLLFEPDTLDQLIQRIHALDASAEMYDDLVRHAQKSLAPFSWNASAEAHIRLYQSVLHRANGTN